MPFANRNMNYYLFKSGLSGEANSRGGFASKIPLSKSTLTPSYGAETTGSGLLSGAVSAKKWAAPYGGYRSGNDPYDVR